MINKEGSAMNLLFLVGIWEDGVALEIFRF